MRTGLAVALLGGMCSGLIAQTNVSFELKRDTYAANVGQTIVQGDFNRDGKPDLIVAGGNAATDLVLRAGNGDGTFKAPVTVGTVGGSNVVDMVAADLDHDGRLDLVVVDIEAGFYVLYGNGDGTFQQPAAFAMGSSFNTAAVGDFNGDGLLDVALSDVHGQVTIFNNVGHMQFVLSKSITLATGVNNGLVRVRAGDLDANGTTDLAVLSHYAAFVLWGDGHGNFRIVQLASYVAPEDMTIGDLNQDGIADVVVSYTCEPPPQPSSFSGCAGFDVFYGQRKQALVQRLLVTTPDVEAADEIWAVDVNGDGIADLAALSAAPLGSRNGLYVWLGHADGTFDQTAQQFVTSTNRDKSALVAGDWNRDGMVDFAQALSSQAMTEIYINGGVRAGCATSQINQTVTVCLPVNDTYTPSPLRVQANAHDQTAVTALQEYVDYKEVYSKDVNSFNFTLAESPGQHLLVTKAWDGTGASFRSDRNVTVYNGTPGPTCAAALGTAAICLPAGSTSGSPVHILANGYTPNDPTAAQLYIDGRLVVNDAGCGYYCAGGSSYVDTFQTLPKGTHDMVFKLWDGNGLTYTAEKRITVQ